MKRDELTAELVALLAPDQGQTPSRAFALALSLQACLTGEAAQIGRLKAEPVSDHYKLVTAADLIAWVDRHPHPTSWVATAVDIRAIVEKMAPQPLSNPQQLAEAPKVEPVGEIGKVIGFGGDYVAAVWAEKMPPIGTKLYTHPAPASDELLEAKAMVLDSLLSAEIDGRTAKARLIEYRTGVLAIAQHKGPQS